MPILEKKKDLKISNLSSYFRKLRKKEQFNSKTSRKKEIVKIRTKINEIEDRIIEKIN